VGRGKNLKKKKPKKKMEDSLMTTMTCKKIALRRKGKKKADPIPRCKEKVVGRFV